MWCVWCSVHVLIGVFFFFNDTATTEIYTLSLHDALPICPFLVAAAPPLFILPISRCGSAPAFYTDKFSLRQRPRLYTDRQRYQFFTARISLRLRSRFLYCPFLVAAAPPFFILTNSRCGSAPAIYTDYFSLRQRPAFYTTHFLLRQRPRFLY